MTHAAIKHTCGFALTMDDDGPFSHSDSPLSEGVDAKMVKGDKRSWPRQNDGGRILDTSPFTLQYRIMLWTSSSRRTKGGASMRFCLENHNEANLMW